jgi:uncharacterized protein
MTSPSNVEVAKAFLEAQYKGEFDRGFQDYASSAGFSWVVSTDNNAALTALIPWAGFKHHGKEEYMELTKMLYSEFEVLEFQPRRFTDAGSCVFVEGDFKFRHYQTQRIAESDFVSRFDMVDGRITGGQFYENTAAVAEARKPLPTSG